MPLQALVVDVGLGIAIELVEGHPGPDDAAGLVEAGACVSQSRGRNILRRLGQFLELAEQTGDPRHLQLDGLGGAWYLRDGTRGTGCWR